jgi:DNA-binding NarL/FixJ family response regulator
MTRQAISLIFLDEHPEDCESVVALIRAQPGYQVLIASAELELALQRVQQARPDIALLNLQPGNGRLALAGALHGAVPDTRVIIMGVKPADEDIAALVRAQVSGFIMDGAPLEQFLGTVHSVVQGIQVLPPALTRPLFLHLNPHGVRKRPKRPLDLRRLTGREREVAELIVRGIGNRDIATQLRITLHTVRNHVHRVLMKLAVKNRLEVASFFQDPVALESAREPPTGLTLPLDVIPIPFI